MRDADGKMMANEKIWRGSISEWQQRLQTWAIKATDEHILLGYNFLSFRFLFGNASLNNTFTIMVKANSKVLKLFFITWRNKNKTIIIPQFESISLFAI